MHYVTLARLGMPIVDNARVIELAQLCEELGQYEFLLTIGPMPIMGCTGVPVNPIATF